MAVKQILIAIDQLINSLLGGWADETLSSRAFRCHWPRTIRLLDAIFGKYHCFESFVSERERLQMPPELRI